jgi:PKD domain
MQKASAMVSEAPSPAPATSALSSFFGEIRDEFALVKKEAATASPLVRAFALLSLVLAFVAIVASINAHGRLVSPIPSGPLAVRLETPDGKAVAPVTAPVSLKAQPVNAGSGEKLTYSWVFGDGATATGATATGATATGAAVTHTYASYGYYVVTVTASGAQGRRASATTTLNILPPAPKAVIKATQDRAYSYMLSADGTSSTGAELAYYWDFGDGHGSDSGDERKVSHFYLAAGTYTLTLTVVDVSGQQSMATKQITVKKL